MLSVTNEQQNCKKKKSQSQDYFMSNGLDYFGRGPTLETAIDALERFQRAFGVESPVSID